MLKHFGFALLLLSSALLSEAKSPMNYNASKAQESLSSGQYEDALDYARQEIADYENNPNGYYQAAMSLSSLQQPGQAISMINKAIEKSKKDKQFAAKCFLTKSELLIEMGDSVQALKALNDGLKADGKNVELLLERGHMLTGIDSKAALKDLQKARKLDPDDPLVYIYTACLYNEENKLDEALEEVTKAISIDNSLAFSYALRGLILQQLGHTPDWVIDCLKSYELKPNSDLGIRLLANADDLEVRKQIIEEIEQRRTKLNGYYKLEADLLYSWDEVAFAGKTYEDIINLGIAEPETYYNLADCQERLGYYLNAYMTASKGLAIYPDEPILMYIKAHIGVIAGKGAEVLEILDELIAQSPEADAFYLEKGKAYMSMGRYSDAVEPFAAAVMINPSAKNKMYYGDALRLSGNVSKANSEYNDILKMSDEQISDEGLEPLYMYAIAHSGLGNILDAIVEVKALSKDNPEAEVTYMPSVYARLGLKDEAITTLEQYSKNHKWIALFDLYSYNFHNLHSEPSFVKLLADNGVDTRYNTETHLLEYVPENIFSTSGGTPLEEVNKLVVRNPSDWLAEYNKLCPIDMGMGGQIVSIEFDEKSMTTIYNCVVNPLLFNFKLINNNPSYKRKKEDVLTLAFLSSIQQMVDLGVTLKYNFKTYDNSEQCSLVVTPSRIRELKRKAQSQDEIDMMMLDFWIEEESLMMSENPETPDVTIKLDGKTLIYTFPTPEEDGTLARIELFNSDLKTQLFNLFRDPSMKMRIPVFLRQNLTLKFSYRGESTGKTVDVVFTPEELSEFIQ